MTNQYAHVSIEWNIGLANGESTTLDVRTIYGANEFCVPADVNGDGVVNLLDVNPFVDVLTGESCQCEADVNGDGTVSLTDVAPFVDELISD